MRARVVGDDLEAVQQGRLRRRVVVHAFDCTRKQPVRVRVFATTP
jgi:hypothetical protein